MSLAHKVANPVHHMVGLALLIAAEAMLALRKRAFVGPPEIIARGAAID